MKRIYIFLIVCAMLSFSSILYADEKKENDTVDNEYNDDYGNEKTGETNPFSQVKFNPDLSLIVDLSGVYRNRGDEYKTQFIPGFTEVHGGSHGHAHAAINEQIGFNFNYAEMSLYAAIDPYFELFGIFHLSEEGFEVEEGFINSTFLPWGFGLKVGKFLSGFGRLNEQHSHYWDFSDQPLVYKAFLGGHGINEVGAQLVWLPATPFFLKFGVEVLQGKNATSFGTDGFHDPLYIYKVKGAKGPNLYTGFIETSFDVGNMTLLFGVSGAYGITRSYHSVSEVTFGTVYVLDYNTLGHGTRARTWILGGELTAKYLVDSYRYVALQGEFLYRNMEGVHYHVEFGALDTPGKADLRKEQSGLYTQLVVKPFLRWRFGGRFDLLNMNRVYIEPQKIRKLLQLAGYNVLELEHIAFHDYIRSGYPANACRLSAMVDFFPSEFSLFRLQYNYDRSRSNRYNRRVINHEVILQVNVSIGAHGAHKF